MPSVIGYQFTKPSKAAAIEALSLAFERQEIKIINHPVLVAELQGYEMWRLPSGMVQYGAPEGTHDDTVIALALAWSAIAGTTDMSGAKVVGERATAHLEW